MNQTSQELHRLRPADDENQGTTLLDLLAYLGEEKKALLGITVAGTAVALAFALLSPRYFVARAVVLPPQQQQSATSGALAQLGALAGVVNLPGGSKSPDEMYVALLKTRRLQDVLIKKFDLQHRYERETLESTRAELAGRVAILADKKSGLISIEATDLDAPFAARLANEHIDELRRLLSTLAVTDAQQRRLFFEQQVSKTQRALSDADQAFRLAQAQGGLVVSQALAEGGVKEGAKVRAQIAALEVQLDALGRFATAENPETRRLSAELSALRRQLSLLESGSPGASPTASGQAAVQAYRNLKTQEAMLDVLIKQYEMAKVDEARDGPLLQVIDQATPPERPAKPKRVSVVLTGFLTSLLFGVLVALMRGLACHADPARQGAWRRVKSAWF